MNRIVLGFSGSAGTTSAIPWLRARHGLEVVTVTLDFGQGDELAAVRERALALGAVRAHVVDVREEFVREYLLKALQAGASLEGHALAPAAVAARLVDLARMESADAVAHGARRATAAHAMLNGTIRALDPSLRILEAPATAEMDLVPVSRAHGGRRAAERWRVEATVWGRSIECPAGEEPDEETFTLTRSAAECPEYPAQLEIEFVSGVPVAANGVGMSMLELIESLETIAGAHGVGRVRRGEVVLEQPAASVLALAHAELEARVLGPDVAPLQRQLADVYSQLVRQGRWCADTRRAIDAFVAVVQPRVTGTVTVRLSQGNTQIVSCRPGPVAADGPKAVA